MHLYLCMNAHKWICLFLGKAQSSFSYHSCGNSGHHTLCTTLATSWAWQVRCSPCGCKQQPWVWDNCYSTGDQFQVPVWCFELYVDNTDRREKGYLGGAQPGMCRERKHVAGAMLIRKRLHLTGFRWGSLEMGVQLSHIFSYSIIRDISKCR